MPTPSAVTDRRTAPHYTWGDACDGWRLLDTPALAVIEERMPPGTAESRHTHARATQLFYVLAGDLTIEVDGHEHTLAPRQSLPVPPNHPHQVFNRSTADATFLVISHPPTHDDRSPAPLGPTPA